MPTQTPSRRRTRPPAQPEAVRRPTVNPRRNGPSRGR
jgi:hypothetical protein